MTQSPTLLFVWENIGPMHADRLTALARALPVGGRVVGIELYGRSATYEWEPARGADYRAVTLAPAGRIISSVRLTVRLVRAALRVGRADCYLCHYERIPVLVTAAILRLAGRRVFALFNSKFDDYPRSLWRETIKSLFLLPYQGALCGSDRSIAYLRFLGLPRDRLSGGYNTLSVDRISALSGSEPAPGGMPFRDRDFIVVARLVTKKNLAMAIDAFAQWLAAAEHPRDLHVCGSGPLEDKLRVQAARLGIADRVRFHGFLQTDAVSALLARSLCLILPSVEEQFGNVVIEAQALGVPALVSSVAGAADVLVDNGINGFVINDRSARACAELMGMIAGDEALWRRLATAAYAGRDRGDVGRFVGGVCRLSNLSATDAGHPSVGSSFILGAEA